MSDLIDRQKLYNYLNDWAFGIAPDERHEGMERLIREVRYETIHECMSAVEDLPSAERKGEWIEDGYQNYTCVCSVCGTPQEIKAKFLYSYCPSCGAKMKGGTE